MEAGRPASAVWRDGRQEISMIDNGWLQIAIFGAIVVAITKAVRLLYDPHLRRRMDALIPVVATG